jgi:hypothetical protein
MGLFPIMMNVLQFWLIDSIVKASAAVALPPDSRRNSTDEANEPLFAAPDGDDDSGDRPPYDIENPRPSSRSSSRIHPHDSTKPSSEAEENKSSASNISGVVGEPPDSVAMHAYPPSIASTSTVRSSSPSLGTSPKRTRKTLRRRSPPPPLHLESPVLLIVAPTKEPSRQAPSRDEDEKDVEKWADPWSEADDWANRVGEEEWTGRRMGHTRDVLNGMSINIHAA